MIELNTTDLYRVGNYVVRLSPHDMGDYYRLMIEASLPQWINTVRTTYVGTRLVPVTPAWRSLAVKKVDNGVFQSGIFGIAADECQFVTLEGCIVRDVIPVGPPGSVGTPHAQGLWCRKADTLTIKDSVFYNIGYDCKNPATIPPSRFNHGVYADSTVKETIIENCWFINCSNFGIKAQGGKIRIKNCVFYECAGAIECGREDPALYPGMPIPKPCGVEIENIVVIRARAISENRQNWGVYLMNTERAVVKNVIMVESLDGYGRPVIQNDFVDELHGYFGCRNVLIQNIWGDDAIISATTPYKRVPYNLMSATSQEFSIDALINRADNEYDYNMHDAATFIAKFAKECGAW